MKPAAQPFEPFAFADRFGGESDLDGAAAPLAEAEAAAYARGYTDGADSERSADAARAAAALSAIADALATLADRETAARDAAAADAARLALAFAAKLAGRLVETTPLAPVLEAFETLARDLIGEARLSLHVAPAVSASLDAALAERIPAGDPRPAILADVTLAPGDCRIDWPAGGLIRDRAALEARLAALIDRSFPPSDLEETTP